MGDKQFHTFDELVALLQSRGVAVSESTKTILKRESYYAVVNGYKDLFLDRHASGVFGDDRFKDGTEFREIYALYRFDRDLRALFLPRLLIAETTLKTLTVHCFCAQFPSRRAYLEPANYTADARLQGKVRDHIAGLEKSLQVKSGRHPKDFIDHYLSRHNHVPLWVLANFLTFGSMSIFYSLQREGVQASVCKELSAYAAEVRGGAGIRVEPYKLEQMFKVLSTFRNICAHEERLFCTGAGRSRDIRIAQMLPMLGIVLPGADYRELARGLISLMHEYSAEFNVVAAADILNCMGFASQEEFEALTI